MSFGLAAGVKARFTGCQPLVAGVKARPDGMSAATSAGVKARVTGCQLRSWCESPRAGMSAACI